MMDHILELDWCPTSSDNRPYLVSEEALDRCCIERIVRNQFRDPLLSSEDEDNEPNNIDWSTIFKTGSNKTFKLHVPGFRSVAPYSKQSVLTGIQHFQCLKVLCAENPYVLPEHPIKKPISIDYRILESLSECYETEKKEFIEWAKSLWVSHCSRVLKLDPIVDIIYETEFKMREKRLTGYPKVFEMAAQIPLECSKKVQYNITKLETLISVNTSELPLAKIPIELSSYTTVIHQYPVPEPCCEHPYRFVLPNASSVSKLTMTEIHEELSQFAAEHAAKAIVSENALKCLVSFDRQWTLPISVCTAVTPDCNKHNVIVIDSEVITNKEPAMNRTYRAYRHLLRHTIVPSPKFKKIIQGRTNKRKLSTNVPVCTKVTEDLESDMSSDDDVPLVIYDPEWQNEKKANLETSTEKQNQSPLKDMGARGTSSRRRSSTSEEITSSPEKTDVIGQYTCTCKESEYELPAPRSYSKWRLTNHSAADSVDVIVHCSHYARMDKSKEIIMDPIPEYQLELGGSQLPPDRGRCATLGLLLRENATLLTVRTDGCTGELVSWDTNNKQPQCDKQETQQVLNIIHTALNELQGLLPGRYLLQHQRSNGPNALLYVSRAAGVMTLEPDVNKPAELDETHVIHSPPTIAPVLLPFHKFRKILPCAFTPFSYQVAKEVKPPPAPKPPPASKFQWPKKKNKGRKKRAV